MSRKIKLIRSVPIDELIELYKKGDECKDKAAAFGNTPSVRGKNRTGNSKTAKDKLFQHAAMGKTLEQKRT